MSEPAALSYAYATSTVPLLGDTIAANLARTVARHGDREALVDVAARSPLDLPPSWPPRSTPSPAGLVARGSPPATGSASGRRTSAEWVLVQYATAAHRRDPRQHQPGLPHPRAGLRARPGRHPDAGRRPSRSRPPTTGRWSPRSGPTGPALQRRGVPRHRRLGRACSPTAAPRHRRRPRRADGRAVARRPDQHPVHVGHDRLPQGRHPVAPQHPQQRLLRGPTGAATPKSTGSASRCRFYHCFGMVMGNLGVHQPRRLHGASRRPAFDPAATLQAVQHERCTSLYGVPTMFIAELATPTSPRTTCRACGPGSWPARPARSR